MWIFPPNGILINICDQKLKKWVGVKNLNEFLYKNMKNELNIRLNLDSV